ncbi:hypothetical protein shim_27200 [Shimia sp. SK013]|nr:hypothetical protein shim_27200 [Shimia sp. SK013]
MTTARRSAARLRVGATAPATPIVRNHFNQPLLGFLISLNFKLEKPCQRKNL